MIILAISLLMLGVLRDRKVGFLKEWGLPEPKKI